MSCGNLPCCSILAWFKRLTVRYESMLSRFADAMGVKDVDVLSDDGRGPDPEKTPPVKKPKEGPTPPTTPKKPKGKAKPEKPTKPQPKQTAARMKRPAASTASGSKTKEAEQKKEEDSKKKDQNKKKTKTETKKEEEPKTNTEGDTTETSSKKKKSNAHLAEEPVLRCHRGFYSKDGSHGLKIVTAKGSHEILKAI